MFKRLSPRKEAALEQFEQNDAQRLEQDSLPEGEAMYMIVADNGKLEFNQVAGRTVENSDG